MIVERYFLNEERRLIEYFKDNFVFKEHAIKIMKRLLSRFEGELS